MASTKTVRESQLDEKQLMKAVPALLKYSKKKSGENVRLLDEHETIWLIVALKKVPQQSKRPIMLPLPHSLHDNSTEICLISKLQASDVKKLLSAKGVSGISKVISLTKLRKNYMSYESKRHLCSTYDGFLCDDRIYHLLPKLLGKTFFTKQKFPVPVDLKKTDLQKEFTKTLQCTAMKLGHGSCSAVKVSHTGMTEEHTINNIRHAIKVLTTKVPRGWNNIQSLNIKTSDSISLPLYTSLPDGGAKISLEPQSKKKKVEDDDSDED